MASFKSFIIINTILITSIGVFFGVSRLMGNSDSDSILAGFFGTTLAIPAYAYVFRALKKPRFSKGIFLNWKCYFGYHKWKSPTYTKFTVTYECSRCPKKKSYLLPWKAILAREAAEIAATSTIALLLYATGHKEQSLAYLNDWNARVKKKESLSFSKGIYMSENSDKTNMLGGFISTAEYVIANYLKDHNGCLKRELMNHVLGVIDLHENRSNSEVHQTKPIHTLAWLIAFKEMEKEGVIRVERHDLPFPMVDDRSLFYLK